jgi:hypothetical protein
MVQVFALGIVSVFDQILDDMDAEISGAIFEAYISSLGEKASEYREDAEKLVSLASACTSADGLTPDVSGSEV